MNNKPVLDIPKTFFEKLLDALTTIVYLAVLIYTIVIWSQLPDQVPAHYNSAGEINRWGSKWELILLPIIAAILAVFMTFLERHPEWHNYMKLNENNIEFQYKNSRLLMNVLKNECVLLFIFLTYSTEQVALGKIDSLGMAFLPIFLVIIFGSMAFFIVRSLK
ncbi:DUF1648 domain-containing protein [Sporosarcina luteola]|uniref:DUF1648 domain-containing protein n=1 Tax=Sporosarcina luteola TaxID=582850 RepID=UPI00203A5830|nr:DUF1648 domain-containing protein [Sporosarcina luteola]MCM3744615.1 DUF1648 domain-containing protein [Sporosarcina luteola]